MKDYVARAMQIACMDKIEIERLHKLETRIGYCIPNWNIQKLFQLRTIKEIHMIPLDEGQQALHSQRIELELEPYTKIDIDPENRVFDTYKWTHAFDWIVNRNPKGIDFNFQGNKRVGNISSKLGKSRGQTVEYDQQ